MTQTNPARLTYAFARDKGIVLLEEGDTFLIGIREDTDPFAIMEARRVLAHPVRFKKLSANIFENKLSELYTTRGVDASELESRIIETSDLNSLAAGLEESADLLDSTNDAPVIQLINGLIAEAVRKKASDIHIEPFDDRLSVRLRIDGVMGEILTPPRKIAPLLSSRIKVMARLDIAEKRVPQDGRVSITIGGRAVDIRVSTLPSRYGERVVMRILDKEAAHLDLDDLGMDKVTLNRLAEVLKQPNGIILVTGPTGSGKTTTLYAGLTLLNNFESNILTVEDPIEYGLNGIGQTQVNTKVGMTFATGLRAILRQDPDIVMVGEIRDNETAQIAVQASLTGHLVLSTVHTNSAAAALTRLRDMGVEPFLLSSTLSAVLAQRLVRRLCESCKEPYTPPSHEAVPFGIVVKTDTVFYRSKGCENCDDIGFRGRLGIFELLVVDNHLRTLIHGDSRESEIEEYAFKNADTLLKSAARHVRAGFTTPSEVLRVVKQAGVSNGSI